MELQNRHTGLPRQSTTPWKKKTTTQLPSMTSPELFIRYTSSIIMAARIIIQAKQTCHKSSLYYLNRIYQTRFSSLNIWMHIQTCSGVPQESVLGLVLYLLYTADLAITRHIQVAPVSNDTAVLAVQDMASLSLKQHLYVIHFWLKKTKANAIKSAHVTFTMKKDYY